ncbi:hypothetical protein FB45DRAFT_139898 [Roridomyces roridus]|uniref:Stress-response A/B barrel domain-containing protein n=1 Tax=Roridomyces roridus TaxID=1738132 RepID=A0AAD7BHQ4_9AGAR|nr:hypothetical protein FB45DRAFT_139898 [Roridomyces roridus]
MPVQHFTLAKFRNGTTCEAKNEAIRTAYLLAVAALSIPGVTALKVGPPVSQKGARGYEFALTVEFEDIQAFRDYIPHPHHRLVAQYINNFSEGTPLSYQIDTSREARL